jgi:hypothetical protein
MTTQNDNPEFEISLGDGAGKMPATVRKPVARLPYRRPLGDILNDLHKPIPRRLLKQLKQGNQTIDYLAWNDAVKLLDYYAPGWEGQVVDRMVTSTHVVITYRITLHAAEGSASREATGNEMIDLRGGGDPFSNAEAMAFKRAAAKFGLGLHLYDRF